VWCQGARAGPIALLLKDVDQGVGLITMKPCRVSDEQDSCKVTEAYR
jgi:hypothetical protein